MANRTSLRVFLSLSWLACRPQALQLQASTPNGAYITLAGRAKCGTSHLYNLLSSHRAVFRLRKEECPGRKDVDMMDEGLFAQFLDFTVSRAQAKDGSWLRMEPEEVQKACANRFRQRDMCRKFYENASPGGSENGTKVLQSCVHHPDVVARMQKLVPVPNARVLFLQRDPADMLWSAYNFWANQMDAPHTVINPENKIEPWTNKLNYRSPGHFHELVASEGRLTGGISDWSDYIKIQHMHKLRKAFGRNHVLFLRSEDMHLRDTVQRICDFVGLDIDGIPPELIDGRTNSQGSLDDRGIGHVTNDEQPGRYEVSGFKPMLCKTRALIYSQTRDVCSQLDKEFGLHYPECLGSESAPACPDDSTLEAARRHHGYWWYAAKAAARASRASEGQRHG